ncbi:MAG TPA: METTL5 family protein [Candidatus Bathyarchaeia archaeon]|nr:METTL5 family protein [Candidatus Bathyarchaeia archaeon]
MGTTAQKRLVRRLDLERVLQQVEPYPSPKARLEQYTIPVDVASEILFIAAYVNDDILGKTVVDLGCGTGRLAIGAAFIGAREVVGVDVDVLAVRKAKEVAEKLNVKERLNWIVGDIGVLRGKSDTVLQNPPFGVQRRTADREFLLKALELAPRIYSLHKGGESTRAFIKRFIESKGGKVTSIFQMKLDIPRMFEFHTKRKHEVDVDLYRIEVKEE